METIKRLKKIIDNYNGLDNEVTNQSTLSMDLGLSSLAFFEIINEIEKQFHVKINDLDLSKFKTVGDLVNYLDADRPKTNTEDKMPRASGIDLIKALCMLGLPLVHIIEQFAYAGALNLNGFNPECLLILTAVGPGIFLICLGYELGSDTSIRQLTQMGMHMLLIGLILNVLRFGLPYSIGAVVIPEAMPWDQVGAVIVESDIYFYAGLFYFLLALLKKLRLSDFAVFMTTIMMLSLNTVIMALTHIEGISLTLSAFLGNFFYVDSQSIFPILSWAVFPVIGMLLAKMGPISQQTNRRLSEIVMACMVGLIALGVSLWYFGIDLYMVCVSPANAYITELFNVIIQIGLGLLTIALLQILINQTASNPLERFLYRLSPYLMPYYFIHWIFVGWLMLIFGSIYYETYAIPFWVVLLLALAVTLLTIFLSKKYGMKLMRSLLKITSLGKKKENTKIIERLQMKEMTLNHLLKASATTWPDVLAYAENNENGTDLLTRKDLCDYAENISRYLTAHGMIDQKIGILCENSLDWAISFFGTVFGRNTAVLMNGKLPGEMLLQQIKMSDCQAIFVPDEMEEQIKGILGKNDDVKVFSFSCIKKIAGTKQKGKVQPPRQEDTAVILFTSGTTGKEKGVVLSHENLVSNVMAMGVVSHHSGWHGPYKTVIVLPLYHAYALSTSVLFPLYLGGSGCFIANPRKLVEMTMKFQPDYLSLVPGMVKMLINGTKNLPGGTLKNKLGGTLTHIFCGGSALPDGMYDIFRDSGILLCNGYGITECSPLVSVNLAGQYFEGSLGMPLDCNAVRISENGEILVKGSNVMKGYYKDDQETEDAFEDGWFKTGDLGKIGEKGELYFSGRMKNLIILSNGENVPAEYLENIFSDHPSVLGVKAYGEGDLITLEIFPDREVENVREIIKKSVDRANKNLPQTWRICKIIFREKDFERTSTGKIK